MAQHQTVSLATEGSIPSGSARWRLLSPDGGRLATSQVHRPVTSRCLFNVQVMWIKKLWGKFLAWLKRLDAEWDEEMARGARKGLDD